MKQKRITYGVNGMMEYQAIIRVGKNNMKVLFSDGSLTAMGINPATFTTDSFMVQHAIENSTDFKRGLIYVVRVIELNTDLHIERNEPKKLESNSINAEAKASTPKQKEDVGTDTEAHASTPDQNEGGEEAANIDSKASTPDQNEGEGTSQGNTVSAEVESDEQGAGLVQLEFASNDEAKDYLEQKFGLVRSKLRNRDDIRNAGRANGVEIIFI